MEGSSFVLIIFVPHISGGPQRMISYHIVCVGCVAAIVERMPQFGLFYGMRHL